MVLSARLPGSSEEELRTGLEDLRNLARLPGAGLGWTLHKSTAVCWTATPQFCANPGPAASVS